jgi:hypothetical protein
LKASEIDPVCQKEDSVGSSTTSDALSKSTPGRSLGSQQRVKPTFLSIDRIIESLSTVLTRAGARKVAAIIPERTVRLSVDQKEMDEAFATLGTAVARGAVVTIRGDLVQIETGEGQRDQGCALLSISVRGGHAADAVKMGVRDALSAVRGTIRKHSGCLRFWTRPEEMQFSLYLPVLH